jgi:hypothetical protein
MPWWQDIWTRRSEDWTLAWLPSPASKAAAEAQAEQDYLSIVLKSARVVDVRKGFTTFFGTVHSYIRLPHRSNGLAEFNVVTTPGALKNVDATGIDRVLQLNQRLLGPVPYVGGDLEIEVGLFSVASANLAGPYLALLENLSKTAGVASVGAALPFAAPIVEGMKLLTSSERDVALEVGLATMQPVPKLGYCAVVRAPKATLDVRKLQIDDADFRLLHERRAVNDYLCLPRIWFFLKQLTLRASADRVSVDAIRHRLVALDPARVAPVSSRPSTRDPRLATPTPGSGTRTVWQAAAHPL